jgi:hypothetical protein
MTLFPVRLVAFFVLLGSLFCAGTSLAGEPGRSLPFNKQSVYNYFRHVEEARRDLPENLPPEEFQARLCNAYASKIKQAGYDFEATVLNAVQLGEHGMDKLNDPRFMFLAGVFQIHPDVYMNLKFISKTTRDAVVKYFGG